MDEWHYWLFEGEQGALPLPISDPDPALVSSIEDARSAASHVGRVIDIYRTPALGGISEFVETVRPAAQVIRPESVPSEESFGTPAVHRVEVNDSLHFSESIDVVVKKHEPQIKALEARLADVGIVVRSIRWTPTSDQTKNWLVEALDDDGEVLGIGVGDDPQDAYLELWDHMKPE